MLARGLHFLRVNLGGEDLRAIARGLGEFGALLVVSGNVLGRTQTATLFIHDAVENFDNQAAYAASLVLAAISFALLLLIEYARAKVAEREERS